MKYLEGAEGFASGREHLAMSIVYWLLRLGLGGLILATGVGKALDVPGFIGVLQTYRLGLGNGSLWAIGLAVTIFELALGPWILSGRKLARAMEFAMALNFGYFVLMTSSLWRGLELQNCGCYGVYFPQPLRWYSPLEDVALIVLSLLLLNIVTERMRAQASTVIRAPSAEVAAAYRDFRNWPRIFPATIRGAAAARGVGQADHRSRPPLRRPGDQRRRLDCSSAEAIGLEEFKRRYDARFDNRFEPVAEGTRYTVSADVRPKGAWKLLLGPCLRGLLRHRITRDVLGPLKTMSTPSRLRMGRGGHRRHARSRRACCCSSASRCWVLRLELSAAPVPSRLSIRKATRSPAASRRWRPPTSAASNRACGFAASISRTRR